MSVRKSKGSSLIEAMVALFIAMITIMSVALVFTSISDGRENLNITMEGAFRVESIKKLLLCNYSYEDIRSLLKDKKRYLDKEDLIVIDLQDMELSEVLKESSRVYPRMEIQGKEGQGGTMIIDIIYYLNQGNKLVNRFYRGNYEEE